MTDAVPVCESQTAWTFSAGLGATYGEANVTWTSTWPLVLSVAEMVMPSWGIVIGVPHGSAASDIVEVAGRPSMSVML